ncbi:hypothetical protein KFE25_010273 [Diacronema lutheri]|uniref:Regulator of microtubule dynamics protein 1 n=1 Tax=Diacronema lutheri TaxID=2081491 RepID=A0A8J5XEJ6_DIALT|nr:hypothetical protein KFE25_010273 [Diacronema lutheri]
MRRGALTAAGTAAVAGYMLYRLHVNEHALRELRERLDEVAGQARKALQLIDALHGAAAPHAQLGPSMLSSSGSFASVGDVIESVAPPVLGAAPPVLAAKSAAEQPAAAPRTEAARAPTGAPQGGASPWAQADRLFDASRHAETIELLGGVTQRPTDDCDRLWRLARALHAEATALGARGAKEAQVQTIARALALSLEAVRLDDRNFAAHKWAGIVISEASSLEGTKAAIERSVDVRAHFERAVELCPDDPTSRHLLGLWHFEIASIGWLQKKAASALFAEPPSSTHDVALELLLAAEALRPGFYKKNRLLIAKAQLKLGERAEARRWLGLALEMPSANADDEAAHAEALALARTL